MEGPVHGGASGVVLDNMDMLLSRSSVLDNVHVVSHGTLGAESVVSGSAVHHHAGSHALLIQLLLISVVLLRLKIVGVSHELFLLQVLLLLLGQSLGELRGDLAKGRADVHVSGSMPG